MPDYTLAIGPEWEGRALRAAALSILSSGQFKRAKFEGLITLDGVPVHADTRLRAGQVLRLSIPEPEHEAPLPVSIPLSVPYEDAYFWMIDKPAPLPTACSARRASRRFSPSCSQ